MTGGWGWWCREADAIRSGASSLIPFDELVEVMRVSFDVVESLG